MADEFICSSSLQVMFFCSTSRGALVAWGVVQELAVGVEVLVTVLVTVLDEQARF
jgi:hypothetical protein